MGPLKKSHHGAKIIAKLKGTLGFEDRHRHDGGQDADTDERQTTSSGASVAGKIDLDDKINTSDSTLNNGDGDGDVPASRTGRLETFETTCNRTPGQPAQIPGTEYKDSEMAKDETPEHKITKSIMLVLLTTLRQSSLITFYGTKPTNISKRITRECWTHMKRSCPVFSSHLHQNKHKAVIRTILLLKMHLRETNR